MTKKKWAMVIMGEDYDPEVNRARLDTEKKEGHILTVRDPKEALSLAAKLKEEGFGAIEVCGAFGEELARKMYEAIGSTVPVCYVTTPPDELEKVLKFWGEE